MKYLAWIALWAAPLLAADCPKQAKTTDAMVQTEQSWAHALEARDASVLGCILADEFEDYSATGAVYKRSDVLQYLPQRKPSHNQLSDLQPHLNGDLGYVRGLNAMIDPSGNTIARIRFTDIFAYRDGRWVAVGGQETRVQDPSK